MDYKLKSITWCMIVYGLVVIPSVSPKHYKRSFAERAVAFSDYEGPVYDEERPSYQYLASRYVLEPEQSFDEPPAQPYTSLYRASRLSTSPLQPLSISNNQRGRQNQRARGSRQQSGAQLYGPQQSGPQQYGPQQYGPQQYGPQQYSPQQYGPQQYGAQKIGALRSQPPQQLQGNQPYKESFKEPTDLKKVDITPEIEELIQKGLAAAKYNSKDVKVDMVKAGGRNMNFYRVSYTNPSWNHNCFFKFAVCVYCIGGFRTWMPVCNRPCPGGACRVDRHLKSVSSYDTHYEKSWSDRNFREVNNTRHHNYNTADRNDDFFQG